MEEVLLVRKVIEQGVDGDIVGVDLQFHFRIFMLLCDVYGRLIEECYSGFCFSDRVNFGK